jgi:plasmid maintenance system antidote protein VapI
MLDHDIEQDVNQEVDDRGTDQEEAQNMLMNLRDDGFDADNEKLAIALGRTEEQVEAMISGTETIDDDVVMKARGIALNRGIEIE